MGAMLVALAAAPALDAQQTGLERLPRDVLDAAPPSAHVRGGPGAMAVQPQACRTLPTGQTRRRIVEVAVQEWGFFGFRSVDQTDVVGGPALGDDGVRAGGTVRDARRARWRPRIAPEEGARVAASIAGYWAVTPEGSWIVERQNEAWNGPDGTAARWNAPWSAAFVSWVMCEGGLRSSDRFQRAIAHHTYIDQAIRARDQAASRAAFVAHNAGEAAVAPGDLLCTSRRPVYNTIEERRRQMGAGARTHCDIVVKVDVAAARILAIGGNVRGTVGLKILPAVSSGGALRLPGRSQIRGARPVFAHLKLRAAPGDGNAFDTSPTIKALSCAGPSATLARRAASSIVTAAALRCAD